MAKLTLKEVLADFKAAHGKTYDYSKVIYVSSTAKVVIICRVHGEFLQSHNIHRKGVGCPTCGHERTANAKTRTTKQFIKEARYLHGNTYSYKRSVYTGDKNKIVITCRVHGDFLQEPAAHLTRNGKGCFRCAVDERADAKRVPFEDFVARAQAVHGSKYNYVSTSYTCITGRVSIICPIHGKFSQGASNHCKRRCGCPKCANYGFNPALPATFYVIVTPWFIGYGISKMPKKRIRRHENLLTSKDIPILATHTYAFAQGTDALALETAIKRKTKAHIFVDLAGFKTEALKIKFLPRLLKYVEKYHGS